MHKAPVYSVKRKSVVKADAPFPISPEKLVITDYRDAHCCIERQMCGHRRDWVTPPNTTFVNIYGFYASMGNANFQAELYRSCTMMKQSDMFKVTVNGATKYVCP